MPIMDHGRDMHATKKMRFNVDYLVTYWGYVLAILGQFFGFFKYLCFLMPEMAYIFQEESCMPSKTTLQFWLIGTILVTCYRHIRAMFCLFLQYIFASICGKCLKFFLKSQTCQMEENSCCWKFGPYQGPFWLISGPCSGNLYHIYIPRSMEWFKFSLYCHVRPTWY